MPRKDEAGTLPPACNVRITPVLGFDMDTEKSTDVASHAVIQNGKLLCANYQLSHTGVWERGPK